MKIEWVSLGYKIMFKVFKRKLLNVFLGLVALILKH